MSAKTDKLLSLYRTYENLVRDGGTDPKALEAGMDGVLASEMTLIRQFRNFLSHTEDPGFLEPTDKMLRVLEKQVKDWTMKGDVAKKHAKQAVIGNAKTLCSDLVAAMAKLKIVKTAGVDKGGNWAVYDIYNIAAAVAASGRTSKLASVKALREKPVFVSPSDPLSGIDRDRVTVCTSDGTPSGTGAGLVVF